MVMEPKTHNRITHILRTQNKPHDNFHEHFHEIIQLHFSNHIQIYVNVSKSEHGVGFSVILNVT